MGLEMNAAAKGQVSASAAEIYDASFVPALFGQWAGPLCLAAGVAPGDRVLDVACGTGATTREAWLRAGAGGTVTGLDRNGDMLSVARRKSSQELTFVEGLAEDLEWDDAVFDRVLCQFGLMFFEDRGLALREMRRVLQPRGVIALSVWDRIETSPGYAGMVSLIGDMFGSEAAEALRAPFVLGERDVLDRLLASGGLGDAEVETRRGTARYASIREWVSMDVRGWTLSDMIDDEGLEALVEAAEREFGCFTEKDGRVSFNAPAHIVTWEKPA